MTETREGPPRYFLPVSVLTPYHLGFVGGPRDYREVTEQEAKDRGYIIVEHRREIT